jgi:hypothetical protein
VPTSTSTNVIPMIVDMEEMVLAEVLKGDLFMCCAK